MPLEKQNKRKKRREDRKIHKKEREREMTD